MNQIKITSVNIESLSKLSEFILMRFDNSSTLIDEMDGEEYFYLLLNTKINSAIVFPNNEGTSKSKQFLDAETAGIYETYLEWKSFEGCFNVSSYDSESNFSIGFQGSEITNSENVSDADIKSISSIFTPKNTFELVNELINSI